MIVKSKIIKRIFFWICLLCFLTDCPFKWQVFCAQDPAYQDHGWAVLDSVRHATPFPLSFYTLPRKLITNLPEGSIIRIKALKTGFGNYYKVEKSQTGVWGLKASTRNAKDPASQFLVSLSESEPGKYIMLSSEVAQDADGGFLLASSPQTFDVTLVSQKDLKSDNKKNDMVLWELIEDPKAGDTLESCFLKNKATGGLLTATYDATGGSADLEITNLNNKISELEKNIPYLTITYAKTESCYGGFDKDLARDIKNNMVASIKPYVLDANGKKTEVNGVGGVLEIPEGNWVEDWSGIGKTRWNAAHGTWIIGKRGRDVKVRYMEGEDKTEKEQLFSRIEGNALKIVADINKHPATALRLKLEQLLKDKANMQSLKTSEVARTGYGKNPFPINQWSKVAIEKLVDVIEDDDDTPKLEIPASVEYNYVKKDLEDMWIHRNPEFKGSSLQIISDFGSGKIINVEPLFSRGFVWFDQSLPSDGRGTIMFRALAQEGNVQICFSDAVMPRTIYSVVFGALENTKTVIYKNDGEKNVAVQEISNEQNEKARVTPGMIEQFWVSLNKGFIIAGKGLPGTNIIMAWQDPSPASNIKKFGFSTYKSAVKYTDIQMLSDPIVTTTAKKAYVSDASSIQVGTVQSPAWHTLPLSPAGAGLIAFQATGSEEATLILANDEKQGYAIMFGADGNTTSKIMTLEDGQELYKVDAKSSALAKLDVGKPNKFWVSFYRGQIILGKGNVGENPFCIYVDGEAPNGISKIGFAGKSAIQNLEIWPALEFSFDQNVAEYVKRRQNTLIQGKLNVISPFDYRITQQGPSIVFKDMMTGKVTPVASTPDPGKQYHFGLEIASDGAPKLVAGQNSSTPEKIALDISVKIAETARDQVYMISQQMAYGTGPETIASLVAIAGCAAVGAVGAGLAAAHAALQVELDKMQTLANRYIYTERIEKSLGGALTVSDEAKRDRQDFEAKLKAIFGTLPDSIASLDPIPQLDYITKLWDDALRLITDAYVVENQGTKKSVISGLSNLYNSVKNFGLSDDSSSVYSRMMSILIKAYNNPYLTSVGDLLDEQTRANWYLWINNLAKEFFSSAKLMKKGVEINFKGEYLWFPVAFPQSGKGSVTFEATAYSNIFVCFSDNAIQTSNLLKNIYEIVIGKWDNKVTAIHRNNLGDAVVEFDHTKNPDLSPDPMMAKKYWINIDNGIISGGVGELGQNKLWEWKDPYQLTPVKWVGFSNWLSPVIISNVKVGGPFSASSGVQPTAPKLPSVIKDTDDAVVLKSSANKTADKPLPVKSSSAKSSTGKPLVKKPVAQKATAKKK